MILTLYLRVELGFEDGYFCNFRIGNIFSLESLVDLDAKLRKLDSRLIILRGNPVEILPIIFKNWEVSSLYFESDTESYSVERDRLIAESCRKLNIGCFSIPGHTLFIPTEVIMKNNGKTPLTLTSFLKVKWTRLK